jgi:hypothetical protein
MSGGLSDPGHVWYVRKWLTENAERIAAAVEPPQGPGHATFAGEDFVRWLDNLLAQHNRVCQQEYDRSGRVGPVWTGD